MQNLAGAQGTGIKGVEASHSCKGIWHCEDQTWPFLPLTEGKRVRSSTYKASGKPGT